MIYKYFKKLALVVFAGLAISGKAQQALPWTESFTVGNSPAIPATWTSNDPEWVTDDGLCNGAAISCSGAGAAGAALVVTDQNPGLQEIVSPQLVTSNLVNIVVQWKLYYFSASAVTPTLYWGTSSNPGTQVNFTDCAHDGNWYTISVTLPSGADKQSGVWLKWSFNGLGASDYVGFDDINVSGTPSPIFYLAAGKGPDQLSSWSTNTTGIGGTQPNNFTDNAQTFNIWNNAAVTLTANWSIGGSGTILNLGDGGTQTVNFTIPAGFTFTFSSGPKIVVMNNSTLTLQNNTLPSTSGSAYTFTTGSTVNDARTGGSLNLINSTYYNLIISGGVDKNQNGSFTVSNILNLNGASILLSNSSPFYNTLTLNGTITGAGLLKTQANSQLTIGGTGAFGTLNFGGGLSLRNFVVNRLATGLVTLGTNLTVSNSFSFAAGTLSLNGKSLTSNGNTCVLPGSNAGIFSGSKTSSLTIAGTGAITGSLFMDQSSSSTKAMGDILLNRSGGPTLTLSNALEVWGSITPSVGTISGGGNLTLKSDASNKGRIGIITSSGAFSGSPTIEVFKPAGATGWVLLSSPGVAGKTMLDWNASFAITCASCPDGSTVGGQTFTSIYGYDETAATGNAAAAAHYIELDVTAPLNLGINSVIDATKAYWVYLGDGFPNTGAITIPLTGAVLTGNQSIPCTLTGGVNTENGWNLLANPYPSPILVSSIFTGTTAAQFDNTILVYDPDTDANIPFTASGTNSIIPMGQGFMLRSVGGTVINPVETWKTSFNSNVAIEMTSSAKPFYYNDFLLNLTSTSITKNFFTQAYFSFDGTNGFDNGKDAYSLPSSVDPGTPRIVSNVAGTEWLKASLPPLNGTISIPITVATGTAGVYTISPANFNQLPAGACVNLYDIANNITHNLKNGPYTTTVAANVTVPQFELKITLNPTALTSSFSNPVCKKSNNGSIIATGTTAGPWNYTWKDANNMIIKTTNNVSTADTLKYMFSGVYNVDVNTVGTCDNASSTFTLAYTTPLPTSAFVVNFDSLSIYGSQQFAFTNNSSGANSYSWYFGDGSGSSSTSPLYMYSEVGDYEVTLYSINTACKDSATSKYIVRATAQSPDVSVAKIAAPDDHIKIGKDANGTYVQFNFEKMTKASVSVNNILGQVIINPIKLEGTTDRFYIDLSAAKNQLLFISVDTADKHITQKFFNN